jgi:lactoylglutathione lyase
MLGIVDACVDQEILSFVQLPEDLRERWSHDDWYLAHSIEWWRWHWQKAGLVNVEVAEPVPASREIMERYIERYRDDPSEATFIAFAQSAIGKRLGSATRAVRVHAASACAVRGVGQVAVRGAEVTFGVMDANQVIRGRLIDHVQLVVRDLEASRRFYAAVMQVLGTPLGGEGPGFLYYDELVVSAVDSPAAAGQTTGRAHLAFQAQDRGMVDRFHSAALAAGGRDHGAPGVRPYHPSYYAAFVLDPDGNNIEAVYHGPAERSADSVVIRF